ncbi:hypothetical protein BU17DRAFT_80704 [Hysterangium stoloniferum]|nr:hypothetical protein BU17DRAFT_80704 [Hysterangium stoloniferum]
MVTSYDYVFANLDVNRIPGVGQASSPGSPVGTHMTITDFNNAPSPIYHDQSKDRASTALQQRDMDMQMRRDFDDDRDVGGIMLPRNALRGLWTIPGLFTFGSQDIQDKAFAPSIDLEAAPRWPELEFDENDCRVASPGSELIGTALKGQAESCNPLLSPEKLNIAASAAVGEDSDTETTVSSSENDEDSDSMDNFYSVDQDEEADDLFDHETSAPSLNSATASVSSTESYGWQMDKDDQIHTECRQLWKQTMNSKDTTTPSPKPSCSVRCRLRASRYDTICSSARVEATSGPSTIGPSKPHRESVKKSSMRKHARTKSSATHKRGTQRVGMNFTVDLIESLCAQLEIQGPADLCIKNPRLLASQSTHSWGCSINDCTFKSTKEAVTRQHAVSHFNLHLVCFICHKVFSCRAYLLKEHVESMHDMADHMACIRASPPSRFGGVETTKKGRIKRKNEGLWRAEDFIERVLMIERNPAVEGGARFVRIRWI